jgi:hypothetical protein
MHSRKVIVEDISFKDNNLDKSLGDKYLGKE